MENDILGKLSLLTPDTPTHFWHRMCAGFSPTKQFCDTSWVSYNWLSSNAIYLELVSDPTA